MSALSPGAPLFSIVLPVYNRERMLKRAIESCLAQDFADFELIVVDDGSTDRSVAVAEAYRDHRISVVRHPVNRGVGPARNTGVAAARGEWLVCLDSDDELLPAALSSMAARINAMETRVEGVRFMCRLDSGALSPDPPLRGEVWDYEGYVKWAESVRDRRQESLPCVRRDTFRVTRYPETRMLESCYHLDFARNFRTLAAPDVVRLYHSDAPDQLTNSPALRAPEIADDFAKGLTDLLEKHGVAVSLRLSADLPAVSGRPKQLEVVFANLIKNAAEAMRDLPADRKRELRIEGRSDPSHVIIAFADSGPGVKPEDMGKLFSARYSTKGQGGTGLGLYLSHEIIEGHNGTIEVSSQEGRGTIFTIRLSITYKTR